VVLDFFTVPTVTFKLLYCFFAIETWTPQDTTCQHNAPVADEVTATSTDSCLAELAL
jgi:hypothetical protein